MKIRFYLKRGDINKSGECPIRADISVRGARIQKLIGFSISEDRWDDKKEEVKKGARNAQDRDYRLINLQRIRQRWLPSITEHQKK